MAEIEYYVLLDKEAEIKNKLMKKISKVDVEYQGIKLPFTNNFIDAYLISDNKKDCKKYIKSLDKDIRKYFNILQVGSKIKYTAFLDILGFSYYIKNKITNHYQAEEFYDKFNEVIEYLHSEQTNKFDIKINNLLQNIQLNYSWISDTFVITIEYMDKIKKNENQIRFIMLYRLSIIVSSIHHFMANEFDFTVRGGISSKYACITNNFILGEGVVEAANLEKNSAIYPRVIFEKDIINDELYKLILDEYNDNDLNFISQDCDGYYFVNYIGILQQLPPMIGKMLKIKESEIEASVMEQKIKTIKKYSQIIDNNKNHSNIKVQAKYKWLQNYLARLLPTDGKTSNMFAYNIIGDPTKNNNGVKDDK